MASAGNQKADKREDQRTYNRSGRHVQRATALWAALAACAALLSGSYVFLNLFRFTAQMDSDIAAEALNARAIWEHGALIPATFYPSTERRILNVNLIAALLYGLTGNMNLSMGIACCIMMALLLALYGLLLKRLGVSGAPLWAAMALLLAIPGSMRHSQLLYLYAVYYAVHCVCMLVSLLIWQDVRRGTSHWKIKAAAAAVLAFLISLSGLRAALICYAPLAAAELLQLCGVMADGRKTWAFGSSRLPEKQPDSLKNNSAGIGWTADEGQQGNGGPAWRSVFYAFLLLSAAFAGSKMPTAVGVETSRNLRGGMSKLLHTVIPDLFGSVYCENQSMLRTILMLVFFGAAGGIAAYLLVSRIGRGRSAAAEGACGDCDEMRKERSFVLLFFWLSVLLSMAMGAFTTTDSVWRYYFMIYFVLSFSAACLLQELSGRGTREQQRSQGSPTEDPYECERSAETVLAVCIVMFALLVWKEELWPSMQRGTGNAEYAQIAQWMQEQDCHYGYSTYDSANAITGACNGAVQVSAVADLGTLEICRWLTDSDWYVPSLPVEMKTAYIVPKSLEERFSSNREAHADITVGLETENYTVYIAEHNYTVS